MVVESATWFEFVIAPPGAGCEHDISGCRDALRVKFSTIAIRLSPQVVSGSEADFYLLRQTAEGAGWASTAVDRSLGDLVKEWEMFMRTSG